MCGLLIDILGTKLLDADKAVLAHEAVQGIILFTRNYENPEQLQALVQAIQKERGKDFLISVDHEGGRVQRFREGFSQIPAMSEIYQQLGGDLAQAKEDAYYLGWLMASELRAFDIHLSYAPVLDVMGPSEVIGSRAFHADPKLVVALAQAFMQGMNHAGMCTVGKHFPGHGTVVADSHIAMPVDERSYAEIQQQDLIPFQTLATQLDAVMPAHIVYPQVDSLPAGFSPIWLQDILRHKCQFEGVIITDDLMMAGAKIVGDIQQRVIAAQAAGADLALICNDREAVRQVLNHEQVNAGRSNAAAALCHSKQALILTEKETTLYKSKAQQALERAIA